MPDDDPGAHLAESLDVAGYFACPDSEPEAIGSGDTDLPMGAAGADEGLVLGTPGEEDAEELPQFLLDEREAVAELQGRCRVQDIV